MGKVQVNKERWVVVVSYDDPHAPGERRQRVLGFHATREQADEHVSFLTPEEEGDTFDVMTEDDYLGV